MSKSVTYTPEQVRGMHDSLDRIEETIVMIKELIRRCKVAEAKGGNR